VPAPCAKHDGKRQAVWSKFTLKGMLRRRLYDGVLVFGVTRSKGKRIGKRTKNAKPIETPMPDLRIVDPETWAAVQARLERNRAEVIRNQKGHLLSKPESGLASKRTLDTIARCHVCEGPMLYWNKGGRSRAKYYCSAHLHKGNAGCTNGVGAPADMIDYGVRVKLNDMLNKNPDAVIDLCMERAKCGRLSGPRASRSARRWSAAWWS
jgi:Recombinase